MSKFIPISLDGLKRDEFACNISRIISYLLNSITANCLYFPIFSSLPLYPFSSCEKLMSIVPYLTANNFPRVLSIKLGFPPLESKVGFFFGVWGSFIGAFFFFLSFKSNLGTTKTNTIRSRELLKGDRVEYIILSGVRIEMAHSINALQTLLENTWVELWQRIAAVGHERLILICTAHVYVLVLLDFFIFFKDSQPYNSVHITNQSYSCRRDPESRWQVFKRQND